MQIASGLDSSLKNLSGVGREMRLLPVQDQPEKTPVAQASLETSFVPAGSPTLTARQDRETAASVAQPPDNRRHSETAEEAPRRPEPQQKDGVKLPYFMLDGDQQEAVLNILSQYDPYSLTTMDIQDIRLLFRDIHIPPSRQVFSLMRQQGFDPEQFTQRPPLPVNQGGLLRGDTYAMLLTFSYL